MTSQGQRFRRRALRRGYKVDEVDTFLDRVEATIAGEPIDAPVTSQEVHDVVFRVRFGGYDEWQVDLHLDRVERQLAEATQQRPGMGPGPGPGPDPRGYPPERLGPPQAAPPGPGGPPGYGPGPGHGPGPGFGPGGDPSGPGPMGPPMGGGPGGPPAYPPPPDPGYDRFDEPTYGGYRGPEPVRPGLGGPPPDHDRFASDMTSEMRFDDPGGPPPPPRPGPPDHPGPPDPGPYGPGMPGMGPGSPGPGPGMGAGRGPGMGHNGPPGRMPGGPPPSQMPGSPGPAPGFGPGPGPGPGQGPGMVGPDDPAELQRLDQLRRSFQPRRFGSGYDRNQVDRLFDEVMAGVSGHGPMAVSDADLDPKRFDLVPGGYFEAEVEQALHEVRDILRRL